MTRKEIAKEFLYMVSTGGVREAYEKHVHPDFRHHNPWFEGDRASLMEAMEEAASDHPTNRYEAVRALEDDDLVAVHGRVRQRPAGPRIAVIHIFRFDEDRIAEAWEVGQEVPEESPNANGMF